VRLINYFTSQFGKPKSKAFKRAQKNFMKSLAGYSLVTYILQIKDRHNGNILIDN
jgi:phosphatidylinositol 4-kinase